MNKLKLMSIILLLSMGVSGLTYAASNCSTDCNTSNDCNTCSSDNCSTDCNTNCSTDCNTNCSSDNNCGTSTFFRPRGISNDLTYRNNLTFYNWYHEARCNFFTWDNTFIFQRSRRGGDLGRGFLGKNPLVVAEEGGDVNSINLGLGNAEVESGFDSTISLCPRREVFAWLPQFHFNLDCLCTGFWADIAFAVVHAKHRLGFHENVTTPGTLENEEGVVLTSVTDVLDNSFAFADKCRRTHIDNVDIRVGYDWGYCGNDHVGVYLIGTIPTGKHLKNDRWFQPIVGSRHGAIGVGFEGDYTIWNDESNNSDLVLMSDFKYQFQFRRKENRVFDLNNGPLSRFLLIANEDNPFAPISATDPNSLVSLLRSCVKVEPRHYIEWWLGLHYQWCNWGAEATYNLFWRDRERICGANFNFDSFGIFDQTECGNLTSDSNATIGTDFGQGTADATFTVLTPSDVNLRSGAAHRALTHKISLALSYSNVLSDCYPWYVGFGGGYEFASRKDRRFALENWDVYGKATISF
jgi:hypothetical protein